MEQRTRDLLRLADKYPAPGGPSQAWVRLRQTLRWVVLLGAVAFIVLKFGAQLRHLLQAG